MLVRLLACALLSLAMSRAQDVASERVRRTAQVGRIEVADAPRIDGHLEDACWIDAPAIGELTMVEPWEGRAPTQRTIVRLLHDRHHLYIGLWCFDDDPTQIRASMRARDARLDPDDRVEILLDPFEDRRSAYFFQIGAGGSIGDILISNNGSKFDKPWDTIWSGASSVTSAGWCAEIAIPFRSIPRRDGARSWGFNLQREVSTRRESYRWENATQSVSFFRPSELGTIEGFGEIDGGVGFEVVPYAALSLMRDRTAADPGWNLDPDLGGEAYYRLSPAMTLATTLFTDFAETEDDSRQINLNRFPLFFPEKRDFFLEGSGYFGFGATEAGGTTFLPFFTRRIGLASDGGKIPLLGGAKLTGQAGPFEIGVLDVQADSTANTDSENLAVVRARYAIEEQTTVGLIGTNGNPASDGQNSVVGIDFSHRVPRFVGDMDLRVAVDMLGSFGKLSDGTGESFGTQFDSRGREWEASAGVRWISDDFDPALGFLRRAGSRASSAELSYKPRLAEGGGIRNWLSRVSVERSDEWDGTTQEQRFALERLGAEFHTGDEVYAYARRNFERVDTDFTLFRGSTPVFQGDYWTTRGGLQVETTEARAWNARFSLETGDFFDGRSDRLTFDGDWRLSSLLHLGLGYSSNRVDLGPSRSFTTQIGSGRGDLHFSPALSLRNLVQYDNESRLLGWQSRLRWIYSPGCDFFAVLGSRWLRDDEGSIAPQEQVLEFKLSHSLRF